MGELALPWLCSMLLLVRNLPGWIDTQFIHSYDLHVPKAAKEYFNELPCIFLDIHDVWYVLILTCCLQCMSYLPCVLPTAAHSERQRLWPGGEDPAAAWCTGASCGWRGLDPASRGCQVCTGGLKTHCGTKYAQVDSEHIVALSMRKWTQNTLWH